MSYHWAEVTLFVSIKKKSDADNSLTMRYDGQIHLAIVRNTVTVETIGEFSLSLSLFHTGDDFHDRSHRYVPLLIACRNSNDWFFKKRTKS